MHTERRFIGSTLFGAGAPICSTKQELGKEVEVKGHSGLELNERVDQLAVAESLKLKN